MNLKHLVIIASLGASVAVTTLTTGCHTQGRPMGQYYEDKKLARRVNSALKDEPIYKFPGVNVTAFDGTVQLSGFVATDQQKEEATRVASRVQGVQQLVNNITVNPNVLGATGRTNGPVIYENAPKVPPVVVQPAQPSQQNLQTQPAEPRQQ